jgi:hypothetical protein
VGLLAALALLGLSSTVFTQSVCGCPTVNEAVMYDLDHLDALVRQYPDSHGGCYPTYAELAAQIPAQEQKYLLPKLTGEVDPATRAFTFTPARDDVYRIGYAITPDCRDYVLIGVGLIERHQTIFLFGQRIHDLILGREFPTLHPGDVPPEPSPRG